MRRPTVGSLFSGIGGLDLGLERAGFEVRWQLELLTHLLVHPMADLMTDAKKWVFVLHLWAQVNRMLWREFLSHFDPGTHG